MQARVGVGQAVVVADHGYSEGFFGLVLPDHEFVEVGLDFLGAGQFLQRKLAARFLALLLDEVEGALGALVTDEGGAARRFDELRDLGMLPPAKRAAVSRDAGHCSAPRLSRVWSMTWSIRPYFSASSGDMK